MEETSKQGGSWKDNKKAKWEKDLWRQPLLEMKMWAHILSVLSVLLIIQKVYFVGCVITVKNQVTLPEIIGHRLGRWRQLVLSGWKKKSEGFCNGKSGSFEHLCNTCPKLNRAPGQAGNRLASKGNRNTRNNGNQARGRAFSVNAVDAL
ncbi:hypothetical protein Tco_0488296 [Tanacetum coccineum]